MHDSKLKYKVGTRYLKPYMYRLYSVKPCPFCGSRKMFFADGIDLEKQTVFWIYCSVCNSAGPQAFLQTDAVEAWNARREEGSGADLRYRVQKTPLPKDDDRAVPQYMLHEDYEEIKTHRIPRRFRKANHIPNELQMPYFQGGLKYNERDAQTRVEMENRK